MVNYLLKGSLNMNNSKQRALEEVMEILKITKDLYEIIPAELPEMTAEEAIDISDLQFRLSSLVIIYDIDKTFPEKLADHLEYLSDLIVSKFKS